jgi:hypothetical protein
MDIVVAELDQLGIRVVVSQNVRYESHQESQQDLRWTRSQHAGTQ